MNRRHDIDALRIIAIFLLMLYHATIVFQPWARELISFPQSNESLQGLWLVMQALNIWRIPLLFAVSGIGFSFVMSRRNKKQLILERGSRILLPAIFGSLFLVPIHSWIQTIGTNQTYEWFFNPAHLWFLFNIFIYVLLGILPLYALRKLEVKNILVMTYSLPLLLALETIIVPINDYPSFAVTLHGFIVGAICFYYGFFLAKPTSWPYLKRSGFWHFAFALTLYVLRIFFWDNKTPAFLVAIEASLWLLAAFGLAYRYLNTKKNWITHLSPAVYSMYILHMIVMYSACKLILPTTMAPELQLVIVVTLTIGVSYLGYRLLKNIPYVRVLFGMR